MSSRSTSRPPSHFLLQPPSAITRQQHAQPRVRYLEIIADPRSNEGGKPNLQQIRGGLLKPPPNICPTPPSCIKHHSPIANQTPQ